MAIELPPPIDPVQAPIEQLLASEKALGSIDYQGIRIHITGPDAQPDAASHATLTRLVQSAPSVSDAVRLIARYYYLSGFPAAITRYAVTGSTELHVVVSAGHVESLMAPDAIRGFFAGLVHPSPLTEHELEQSRVTASALSERAGDLYKPKFRVLTGDAVALDFGNPSPSGRTTALLADFSNYGNRYAGPYLADLALRQSFASGDELTLAGSTSVRLFGLGGSHSSPYHGGTLGWSRVTSLGVFSASGRLADFNENVSGFTLDGRIDGGGLGWLYPVYADFNQRLNVEAKFDRNHERLTAVPQNNAGSFTVSETYNSAELTLDYVHRGEIAGQPAEFSTSLGLRQGINAGSSVESSAKVSYFVVRPAVNARYTFVDHWSVIGEASAQLGGSVVPQLEQFVIGGASSVHAYQAGVGTGDSGEQAKLGIEWKSWDDSWLELHGIRPQLFVEYGTTRAKGNGIGSAEGRVDIADVGAETDLKFTSWLGGTLSVAQSIHEHGQASSNDGLARRYVFFRLVARY